VRISGDVRDMLTQPCKRERHEYRRDKDAQPEESEKRDNKRTIEIDCSNTEEEESDRGRN
jgi:hypothetical protein